MTTVQHGSKLTLAEYRALEPIDEGVWELSNGELFEMAPPTYDHQILIDYLVRMINNFLDTTNPLLGTIVSGIGVILSETRAPTPDAVYLRAERAHLIQGSFVEGAPDLVIEALSSDRARDLVLKRGWYDEAGIPEYWTVDPVNNSINVLERTQTGYVQRAALSRGDILTTPAIPGFELPLNMLFDNAARYLPGRQR
ncbi:hypothetical protein GBAR_LOCUS22259 [Geodia barretti]|jgi:Uma2 family endonuclease|uniref:Putative restriction endonuclease domain-containing protein n=1 Tax=Geodia barretti TaxID=519541 RepID=A0AA35T298_GEOBA|nr:hypothetical protein GBAR_LOCUS22259 [Geodia barretti]